MTKIINIGLTLLMSSSILLASDMRLYDIKSGKITYKITGSSNMMGMKSTTTGKKNVLFDNFGSLNLTEESSKVKQSMMGELTTTKTHTMVYMKNSMIYHVNFDEKKIMRMDNFAATMEALMDSGQNMKQRGEEMMIKMGGKKTGTDKVLGYTCDIWELMGTKQCIYKGIPLRVESNMMGILNTEIATNATFDIVLSKNDFKLPDFPIYDMQGNKLDKSNLDNMDKQSEADAQKGAEDIAALGASISTAMQNAGVKKGETPTQEQEGQIEEAMMKAMWPRMKKQFLEEEKMYLAAKSCFDSANTVKEANNCSHEMDAINGISSDPEDDFKQWNEQTKKETLEFINQGLQNVSCIKKAQNMQAMKQCMPKE
ncbi:MAG: hypothetical protein U9O24_02245 [Campylobacterota bacterium]|nr:hypothetical protein [Campylobacterota bacterium]